MEKIKHEKSAGAVVYYFNQESREPYFLLLKYTNYWGFAKGIIEESEESKETALREIKEETGFDGELQRAYRDFDTIKPATKEEAYQKTEETPEEQTTDNNSDTNPTEDLGNKDTKFDIPTFLRRR